MTQTKIYQKIQSKSILVVAFIVISTMFAFAPKLNFNSTKEEKQAMASTEDKMKACISACNASIASCKKVQNMCLKTKSSKMAACMPYCKECIVGCMAASQLMSMNSTSSMDMCRICANICDSCATECEKFDSEDGKKCAINCRRTSKLCREM